MSRIGRGKLCPECGGPILIGKEEFAFHGTSLGEFEVHVCGCCGESSFTPAGSRDIDRAAKEKGLFGVEGRELPRPSLPPKTAKTHA
jgi:hypothetical protein